MRGAQHANQGLGRAFPEVRDNSRGLVGRVRDSARGCFWYARLPLWLYLAYVGMRQLQDPVYYNSFFAPLNLCIHEGGHLLCRGMGEDLHVAGGTLLQLAAPVIAMFILGRQRDFFGITFCFGWLSTNWVGVGVYMADARARELPLVTAEGGDGETIHDWAYMFGQLGLMDYDTTIGFVTRGIGSATMLFALVSGAWIMREMARINRRM